MTVFWSGETDATALAALPAERRGELRAALAEWMLGDGDSARAFVVDGDSGASLLFCGRAEAERAFGELGPGPVAVAVLRGDGLPRPTRLAWATFGRSIATVRLTFIRRAART